MDDPGKGPRTQRLSPSTSMGTVLVIGGCGFVGFHLIAALLQEGAAGNCGPIVAASRAPTANLHPAGAGVTYQACDISDAAAVRRLLDAVQPQVIFHTASPRPSDSTRRSAEFAATNVDGTQNLLRGAADTPCVRAFVFTSSVSVLAGSPHVDADEQQPLFTPQSSAAAGSPYELSKASADRCVREANDGGTGMRTVCLRLCLTYGERDAQFVPGMLDAFGSQQTRVQLGDNSNAIDTLHVANAAKALLDPNGRAIDGATVAGEAFNITDGNPRPFWDVCRLLWRAAGDTSEPKDVTVIPAAVAMAMATVAEWVFWVGTLGQRKPKALNRLVVEHCVRSHTYSIEKARRVLGFEPSPDLLEEGLRRSVEWEMHRRREVAEKS